MARWGVWHASALAGVLAACTYVWVLANGNGFVVDDVLVLHRNDDAVGEGRGLWSNDYWGAQLNSTESNKSWRPVAVLFLRTALKQYLTWRGTSWVEVVSSAEEEQAAAAFLHTIAIALHILNSCLVPVIITAVHDVVSPPEHAEGTASKRVRSKRKKASGSGSALWNADASDIATTLTAAVLAVHPARSENVCYIAASADMLAALFIGASVLLWCAALRSRTAAVRVSLAVATASVCLAAMLTKEMAVFAPVWLVALALVAAKFRSPVDGLVLRCCCMLVLCSGVAYLSMRWVMCAGQNSPSIQTVDNAFASLPALERLAAGGFVFVLYLALMLFPLHLSYDYSPHCISDVGVLQLRGIAGLVLLLAAYGGAAVAFLRVLAAKSNPAQLPRAIAVLGVAWVLGALLPALHVVPIGTVLAERLLYIPMIGIACIMREALPVTMRVLGRRRVLFGSAFIIGILMSRAAVRTLDWKDGLALNTAALAVCERSAKVHGGVAYHLSEHDQALLEIDRVVYHYERSIELLENHNIIHNVGLYHLSVHRARPELGHAERAVEQFRRAVQLKPDVYFYHYDLGMALFAAGELDEAGSVLTEAVERDVKRECLPCALDCGSILAMSGRVQEALKLHEWLVPALSGAMKHGGRQEEILYGKGVRNLGRVLFALGRLQEAKRATKEAKRALRSKEDEFHDTVHSCRPLHTNLDELPCIRPTLARMSGVVREAECGSEGTSGPCCTVGTDLFVCPAMLRAMSGTEVAVFGCRIDADESVLFPLYVADPV